MTASPLLRKCPETLRPEIVVALTTAKQPCAKVVIAQSAPDPTMIGGTMTVTMTPLMSLEEGKTMIRRLPVLAIVEDKIEATDVS